MKGHTIDEVAAQVARIYERARNETLGLIRSRQPRASCHIAARMDERLQLAEYSQLYNDKNEPTTAGIVVKANHVGHSPLPHAYMGHLLLFNRHEVTYGFGSVRTQGW
jgi:hypothetical protein